MDGITYFRLESQYTGDVTKGCGLTASEVDNNFYTLEGRDIKSVTVDGGVVTVELLNGKTLSTDNMLEGYTKETTFEFDEETGTLTITKDGVPQVITGFHQEITPDIINHYINCSSDETIDGIGTKSDPLSVSVTYRTGEYKPVRSFVDTANGEELPDKDHCVKGDRYLVSERSSAFGRLYNYSGVKEVMCELLTENSPWRVPSKEDWDDMLNAVETDDEYRNHNSTTPNKYLGKCAGKVLKSREKWYRKEETEGGDSGTSTVSQDCDCQNCGDSGTVSDYSCYTSTEGVDSYGFSALPAGSAEKSDDSYLYSYFTKRGTFWTSDNNEEANVTYIKRFDYDRKTVYQDIIPNDVYLSLRLVKDYSGDNFLERDVVLGEQIDTVLMPSISSGNKIWTKTNLALSASRYLSVEPNNGQDLDFETKYYAVEWDGNQWKSNQIYEGESLVILNAPNGLYAAEYIIANEELVCVRDQVVGDVVGVIGERLTNIETSIAEETAARESADTALSERLTTAENGLSELTENLTQHESESSSKFNSIDAELQRQSEKDTEIENKLLTAEGTSFDAETGVLSLKSLGGTNDVTVQFAFNFGEI